MNEKPTDWYVIIGMLGILLALATGILNPTAELKTKIICLGTFSFFLFGLFVCMGWIK